MNSLAFCLDYFHESSAGIRSKASRSKFFLRRGCPNNIRAAEEAGGLPSPTSSA
jgi:hypothetical protein